MIKKLRILNIKED